MSSDEAVSGVQLNETTLEPYISLPSRPNLRWTPMRRTDGEAISELYSHPDVGRYSYETIFPCDLEAAEEYLRDYVPALARLTAHVSSPLGSPCSMSDFTCSALRFVPTDASQNDTLPVRQDWLIGAVYITPALQPTAQDEPFSAEETLSKPAEDQTWDIGWDLHPSLHRRGIGYQMATTMIDIWYNAAGFGELVAVVQEDNVPSSGLASKLGFEAERPVVHDWPEYNGGGERSIVRWSRRFPAASLVCQDARPLPDAPSQKASAA